MTHETIPLKPGVSHAPHDAASDNGAVAVALDLVNDNGAYAHIEDTQPLLDLADGERVLAIHQNDDYKHYVLLCRNLTWTADGVTHTGAALAWVDSGDAAATPHFLSSAITEQPAAVEVIGNTLVMTNETETRYFLWRVDDGEYTDLGFRPPMPQLTFGLDSELKCWPPTDSPPLHMRRTADINAVRIPNISDTHSFVPPRWAWEHYKSLNPADLNVNFDTWEFSLKGMSGTKGTEPVEEEIEAITDFTMAGINSFVKKLGEDENRFIHPFFIRYAYELYDGSLMMHSSPVLMIPNSRGPIFGLYDSTSGLKIGDTEYYDDGLGGLELDYGAGDEINYGFRGRVYGFVSRLMYHLQCEDISQWKDIIRGINVYVTPGIYRYNQGGKVYGWTDMADDERWASYYGNTGNHLQSITHTGVSTKRTALKDAIDTRCRENYNNNVLYHTTDYMFAPYLSANSPRSVADPTTEDAATARFYPSRILSLDYRSEADMVDAYEKGVQFYKIYTFEFDDICNVVDNQLGPLPIREGALKSLTGREVMTDDWNSHDMLTANALYAYNHRLNLGDVTRNIAPPLPPMIQTQDNTAENANQKVTYTVELTSLGKTIVLESRSDNMQWICYPHFVFFPDKTAAKLQITRVADVGGHEIAITRQVSLRPHPLLNGAYWLGDVDNPQAFEDDSVEKENKLTPTDSASIRERSLVATSNSDNPFTFAVENRNDVGDGTVLALRSAVAALSEGQFGAHPMYAFTTQGVWSLSPSATGGWNTIQPVTRDVMVTGTQPLSIDTAIIFAAARGLMHIVGSKTTPLTRPLEDAVSLPDKLAAFSDLVSLPDMLIASQAAQPDWRNVIAMAYDYRHQRVYVNNGDGGSWVLNLRNMQWSQSTTIIDYALNAYPGCEFVSSNQIVTVGDTLKTHGLLLTRPIKTGGEFMARLRDVVARSAGVKAIGVFGTRDYSDYAVVGTAYGARVTRHGGTPYKAHSVAVATEGDAAVDHIAVELAPAMRNRYR